jgi:hypothetical protein
LVPYFAPVLPRAAIFQRPTQYKLSALAPLTWDYLRLMSTPRNKRKSAVRESFHGFGRDPGLARNPDYKGNGLQLEFTVEDDGVFTKPWSAAVSYRRQGEWPEMVCAENPNEYFHGRRAAVPTADKPDF